MANVLRFFMSPDDEKAFLRFLGRYVLELYPIRVPADWKAPRVNAEAQALLPDDAAYFASVEHGPVLVDKVKRGPDRGSWRVDEVRSPVVFFERSRLNDDGELASGKLWAEVDVTPQTGRRDAAPDRFRRLVLEVEDQLKTYRRSVPKGFWIGPDAARRWKAGEWKLRDSDHRGPLVEPFR